MKKIKQQHILKIYCSCETKKQETERKQYKPYLCSGSITTAGDTMGKKNKNKVKKVSAKKERYTKFHSEKQGTLNIAMPELSEEQIRRNREDDEKIGKFLRFSKNPPVHEIVERREKSKR